MTTLNDFMQLLNRHQKRLTRQQIRTLKGQAINGDITGAEKGLNKLLKKEGEKAC